MRSAYGFSPVRPDRWEDLAACVGRRVDPTWWDLPPSKGRLVLTEGNEAALRVCRERCPVRSQCLEQACVDDVDGVIRGGYALRQRSEVVACERCGRRFLRSRSRGNVRRFCRRVCWPSSAVAA